MRSQPQFLNDWKARLWCRFFLLSVFATMYLNDVQRAGFYRSIGLDAREYDKYVIEKTNETSARVFPVILNVETPEFYDRLEICVRNNEKLTAIANSNAPKFVRFFQKLPYYISNGWQFLRLYLIKPINTASLEGTIR
jgi:Mg-protoporphyrin IX monomethyl ester (oxidative) cyclase (EC 1.14.13.81)